MWPHWSRKITITVATTCCVVAVAAAGGVALSNRSSSTADRTGVDNDAAGASGRERARAEHALTLTSRIVPANGKTGVAPDAPVVIEAAFGKIGTVHVSSTTGATVAGMLTSSGTRWQSTRPLDYGTSYRVTANVTGSADATVRLVSTFHTLVPTAGVGVNVFPTENLNVGVGQPIVFRFDHFITTAAGRAAVVRHLNVIESKQVLGGWHWFSNNELHFRPKGYWPAQNRITVSWDLDGWNAGDGLWGQGQGVVHFSIGDARIALANLATHQMAVTENGRVVATYPISAGKDADPTMGGSHIVLDRASVVHMVSSTNGVPVNSPDGYDELVYWDVHISDSGEYVHAAPWSINSQGQANVSHGCINLSPANAEAFFHFSHVGDVVLVGGGPRPPAIGDHGVMDWDTPWTDFTPANTILHVPASLSIAG